MIQEILIREIIGKGGIARPVKIVAGAGVPDKLGHTDMQISVNPKKRGDRKLRANDYDNPD